MFPVLGCNSLQNASEAKEAIAALHFFFFPFCLHEGRKRNELSYSCRTRSISLLAAGCLLNYYVSVQVGVGERKH